MTEGKSLQPLSHGVILIAGVKASNFDDEIRTHPRVIMWESQNEHWLNKDIPMNTRAIFMTRFIGHNAFSNILSQARKRRITIFNPEGTGIIARQVKELLALTPQTNELVIQPTIQPTNIKETIVPAPIKPFNKLHVLKQFIDFNLTSVKNAHILLKKAEEMHIDTTHASLAQFVGVERRKRGLPSPLARQTHPGKVKSAVGTRDVSIEILENMIKSLEDMRDFISATVEENKSLRAKLNRFKKVFEE